MADLCIAVSARELRENTEERSADVRGKHGLISGDGFEEDGKGL